MIRAMTTRYLLAVSLTATLFFLTLPATTRADTRTSGDLSPIQDMALQQQLNRLIDSQGWQSDIENRSMAVALVLIEDQGYRLAMLNGERMVYAASLPKIAILFAAMVASQEGDLIIDSELEQDLNDMIRVSCNPCATRVMEHVGREKLLNILQRPEYEFYDDDGHGGLWVGKDYAGKAAHSRDPIHGLSHGASAYQVARIYYHLYRGTLLDEKHSAMMRDMLSEPGIAHKFVRGLSAEHDLELWRKSGSWKNFHADSVLAQSPQGAYILVGLIEGPNGDRQLEVLALEANKLVQRIRASSN